MFESLLLPTLYSFIALFIIIDPFLGLALFIVLTKRMDRKEKFKQAFVAVGVAFILLMLFLFSGMLFLKALGIQFSSFMVAGGVILMLMGVQAMLGLEFAKKGKNVKAATIVVATPILTGPGAMTTVVILSQKYGYWPPAIAAFLVMLITWIMFSYADKIHKIIGERITEILSRVLGLFLVAIAAEFIKNGIIAMIHDFKAG